MAPSRASYIVLQDSDEDDDVAAPSKRPARPLDKPRDKTSRVATKGSVVDLTGDQDSDSVGSAVRNRSRHRSPPSAKTLAYTHVVHRSSSPHKRDGLSAIPKVTHAMIVSSDSENELPDDPAPNSSSSRPAQSSDLGRRPKAGLQSNSRNPSNTSSPKKRPRDEDSNLQSQHISEKRRRIAVLDGDHEAARSPLVRSLEVPPREILRQSASSAVAENHSSDTGASDTPRANNGTSAPGPFGPASTKADRVTPNTEGYSDIRLVERNRSRRELQAYISHKTVEQIERQSTLGGALEESTTKLPSPTSITPQTLPDALAHNPITNEHVNGTFSIVAIKERRKQKGKLPASTLGDEMRYETNKTQKRTPSARQSPVIDETSAGASRSPSLSPSSQLHREAGDDSKGSDYAVQMPTELEATKEQAAKPQSSDLLAPTVTDKSCIVALPMFPVERQVERVLGKYYQEMREDTDYFTKAWLKRSRRSAEVHKSRRANTDRKSAGAETKSAASAIFARLRAATTTQPTTASAKIGNDHVRLNIDIYNGTSKSTRSYVKAKPTHWDVAPTSNDVPEYAHYVSLNTNVLAPNTTTMTVWPYFGDGEPDPEEFDNYYRMDTDQRHRKIRRLLEAQKVEEYIESALHDLKIAWDDVLHFLLEQNPDVGTNKVAQTAISNRDDHREDFPKVEGSKKWTKVLSSLSATNQERLTKAAILCDNFQRMAKFPLWHVARRSGPVKRAFQARDIPPSSVESRICRICLQFNCHQHGELQEMLSESDSGAETDDAVTKDILYPLRVNFRKRVSLPRSPSTSQQEKAVSFSITKGKKTPKYWQTPEYTEPGDWPPFYPCDHPGMTCERAGCSCFENKRPCEKSCTCAADCRRKFQGCSCASFKHKKPGDYVCWRDDRCACYKIGRECDPDLCGSCGVCDVLDPVHRHDHDAIDAMRMCHNASIQKGVPKHTLLGDSGIHGMGLYAGQHIKAHEFVGEYKGEVITKEEADRRGAVYEKQKSTYLFSLNKKQEVDSNFYGNKIRFINHRNNTGANVYPLIMLVNTVHRIGLFAQQDIKAGEELFFDYGPKFPEHLLGGPESAAITSKSAPHVRNANMVLNDFYDVEDDEDEAGNRRARKAATNGKNRGRPRKPDPVAKPVKPKGKMGGARPGAGRKPGKKKKEATRVATASGKKASETDGAAETPRITSQDRFESYYISENKDPGGNGDDGDDEDFVDEEPSEVESSEEEEHSDHGHGEPIGRSRYGRVRGKPERMKS